MPPVIESFSTTTYGSRTNTPVTAPTGIQDNDLLLLWHIFGAGGTPGTVTPPSGFSLLTGTWPLTLTAGGFTIHARLWSKVASGESGGYTVTHAADSSQAAMLRISGADPTAPFTPAVVMNSGTGGTTTWTGLTTATDNSLVILFEFDFGDTTTDTLVPAGSSPAFTEIYDGPISYIAAGTLAVAGATGDKTHTNNSTTGANGFGALTVAVQPLAGNTFTKAGLGIIGP